MIKLLLADDHKIIRDGVKSLLSNYQEIEIVGECKDGSEVIHFLDNKKADIILMDINMPNVNGIEASKVITSKKTNTKILAFSMDCSESYISKMLNAGANGYVLKNDGRDEIIEAINKLYNGGSYFSSDVTSIMMNKYVNKQNITALPRDGKSVIEDLTAREVQVLKLISGGLTNRDIAKQLNISPKTVDSHRRSLLQKVGTKNAAGLVRFAFQQNLIE